MFNNILFDTVFSPTSSTDIPDMYNRLQKAGILSPTSTRLPSGSKKRSVRCPQLSSMMPCASITPIAVMRAACASKSSVSKQSSSAGVAAAIHAFQCP